MCMVWGRSKQRKKNSLYEVFFMCLPSNLNFSQQIKSHNFTFNIKKKKPSSVTSSISINESQHNFFFIHSFLSSKCVY